MTSRDISTTCVSRAAAASACRGPEDGGRYSGADLTSDEAAEAAVAEAAAAVRRTPPLIPLCLSQLYVRAGKACEGAEFPCWQTAVEGGVAAAAAAPELWCINSCTKSQFEPTLQAQLLISQYVITAVLGLREDAPHPARASSRRPRTAAITVKSRVVLEGLALMWSIWMFPAQCTSGVAGRIWSSSLRLSAQSHSLTDKSAGEG